MAFVDDNAIELDFILNSDCCVIGNNKCCVSQKICVLMGSFTVEGMVLTNEEKEKLEVTLGNWSLGKDDPHQVLIASFH